jgi:hypothetical protein
MYLIGGKNSHCARNPPMLLNWLANKAAIDEASALLLWQRAWVKACEGACPDTPEHYRISMDTLLEYVAHESARTRLARVEIRPWLRLQRRITHRMLSAVEQMVLALSMRLPSR